MPSKVIAPGCAAGSVLLCLSGTSLAGFSTVAHHVSVDADQREVRFVLEFNEPPDFDSTDAFGDDASAFQIFIKPQPTADGFNYDETAALIRAVQVPPSRMLPIWDFSGTDGFGELRGKIPMTIDDRTISFSATFDQLREDDGLFDYRLESYSFGQMTDQRDGTTVSVPLPLAMWSGGALLGGMGLMKLRRVRRA